MTTPEIVKAPCIRRSIGDMYIWILFPQGVQLYRFLKSLQGTGNFLPPTSLQLAIASHAYFLSKGKQMISSDSAAFTADVYRVGYQPPYRVVADTIGQGVIDVNTPNMQFLLTHRGYDRKLGFIALWQPTPKSKNTREKSKTGKIAIIFEEVGQSKFYNIIVARRQKQIEADAIFAHQVAEMPDNNLLAKTAKAPKKKENIAEKPQKVLDSEDYVAMPKKLSAEDIADLERPRVLPTIPMNDEAIDAQTAMDTYIRENPYLGREQVLEIFEKVKLKIEDEVRCFGEDQFHDYYEESF